MSIATIYKVNYEKGILYNCTTYNLYISISMIPWYINCIFVYDMSILYNIKFYYKHLYLQLVLSVRMYVRTFVTERETEAACTRSRNKCSV